MEAFMFDVNFEVSAPQLICHPDLKKHESLILEKLNPYFLRDHFILFSSGTSGGDLKGYALSKKAIFANAEAVNKHFNLSKEDVWGLSLPVYHVGGLSVLARAYLSGSQVVDGRKWDPLSWVAKMSDVTITTLVPTQLYDLVKLKIRPWEKLRFVVIGGDFLSSALKDKARELGWPVIRTYGMSEVSSQLASAIKPDSDELIILSPHEVKTDDEQLLVKSKALFTLEFILGEKFIVNTARELSDSSGFYITKDRAHVQGNIITPLGRIGDEIKISGHLVDFLKLRETLANYLFRNNLYNQMELGVEDDARTGKKLILFAEKEALSKISADEITKLLKPVKVHEVRIVQELSRTSLGKFKK